MLPHVIPIFVSACTRGAELFVCRQRNALSNVRSAVRRTGLFGAARPRRSLAACECNSLTLASSSIRPPPSSSASFEPPLTS